MNKVQRILCDLCANVLFDKKINLPSDLDFDELFKEAEHQTVFPLAWVGLKNEAFENSFYNYIAENVRVNYNHVQICDILSENNIPYVVLKGVASAGYYKEPVIRIMGDVDILINPCDIQKVNDLLQTLGYFTNEDIFRTENHIAYKRKGVSVCEVHFRINGVPDNLLDTYNKYFENVFESAVEISVANGKCRVPDELHHGIILLLHTATHLTDEGIGLRHLCDWAVFVNRFSSEEFVYIFEKPFKEMGLWRFAQLLTLCCEKFLGSAAKEWAGYADEKFLFYMITDILNGGNFGIKDTDRYGQIKYIKNREVKTVETNSVISQLLLSINAKAKREYKFVNKNRLFLPIGWIAVIVNYFILVLTRKRKLDGLKTINNANHRKSIYSEFRLFEQNK